MFGETGETYSERHRLTLSRWCDIPAHFEEAIRNAMASFDSPIALLPVLFTRSLSLR